MDRLAKMLGVALVVAGLGMLLGFGGSAARTLRDPELQRARLAHARNPGNLLYEAQYARRMTPVLVLVAAAVCGFLAAMAGLALWVAGRAGARIAQLERALAAAARKPDRPAARRGDG